MAFREIVWDYHSFLSIDLLEPKIMPMHRFCCLNTSWYSISALSLWKRPWRGNQLNFMMSCWYRQEIQEADRVERWREGLCCWTAKSSKTKERRTADGNFEFWNSMFLRFFVVLCEKQVVFNNQMIPAQKNLMLLSLSTNYTLQTLKGNIRKLIRKLFGSYTHIKMSWNHEQNMKTS